MNKLSHMLTYFRACVLSLLLLGISINAGASHLAAADIHVDYVGTGPTDYTYKITLNVYKSCEPSSIDLSTAATLNWTSSCMAGGSSLMGAPIIDTLDHLCDTFKSINSCRDVTSPFPAFVRHTWVKIVTLAGPCKDWVFSWTDGARNVKILNLLNPSSNNIYVDALINNTTRAAVNSPRYTIDPIPYFCLNVGSFFPNAPVDPDPDSLVSLNAQPRTGPGAPISYSCAPTPPTAPYCYSLLDPIASKPSDLYKVDANTGTASFTPTITGKFVLAFQTRAYDKVTKELMSYTTRDVQVSVLGCTSPPPTNDTFPSKTVGCYIDKSSGTLFACPGANLRFDVGATSNSTTNMIYARWDLSPLPGATYTTVGNGTKRAVGTLNWTPTKADVGDHIIKLRFADSTCSTTQPLVLESFYILKITVLPFVQGGKDGIYCIPAGAPYQMKTVVEPGMRYKWTSLFGSSTVPPFMDNDTLARPTVSPAVLSRYMVEGSIYVGPYRCTTRDTVDVRIGTPLLTINAGPDDTVCANKPITLKGTISPMADLDRVAWSPASTLDDSTKITPTATPYITTDYVMYVLDRNGCGFADTARIVVDGFQPLIAPYASRDTVCPEGFTQLFANVSQQPCGLAQSSCSGAAPLDKVVGTGTIASVSPTPFFQSTTSGGERMQILYQRDELLAAGLKAGFINSLAFNLPAKNSSDTFYKFTIKMACTPDAILSGSTVTTYPGSYIVYPSRSLYTTAGWNNFVFPNAYYWDGSSNLVVDICWSKVSGTYAGTPDPVYCTNTSFTSVKYIPGYTTPSPSMMGDGCSLSAVTPLLASTRPNTKFNVCIVSNLFKYSWTPTSYLNQPDSANTNVNGIQNDIPYAVLVTATSNPRCFATGVVPITVDRTNSVTALPFSPVIQCRPGYFYDLDANGNGPKPLRNLPCGTTNTVACGTLDSRVIANPQISSVVPEPFIHPFTGAHTTSHTQYIIPKSSLRNGNITSGTIRSIGINLVSPNSMDFTNLKIGLKCTDTKQFTSTPPVTFETGVVPVYASTSEVMSTLSPSGYYTFTFNTPYNWDTTKNLLIDFCYAQATAGAGPTVNIYPTPGFNLMVKSYQTVGDVCNNPSTEIGPVTYENLPNFQINFCSAGDTDFTYRWTPGDFFEDSLMKKPLVYIGEDTKLFVTTRGKSGCLVKDSITIIVPKNQRYVTHDTTICLNESIQLRSYNGTKTTWYEMTANKTYDTAKSLSCDSCERVVAKPTQTTSYFAAVTDANGCIDTFGVKVTVKPLPNINITNKDTVLKYGKSIVLNVFGGTQYFWTPMAGLSNPNQVNPTAQPMVSTMYHVVGIGMNGCRGEDSVKINIDYKSPVSVPSAFTPNGDGKNDKFRILGVTFQTLTEFRVFNRWGQEVFTTQDINDGWDGTFKGKAAEMGTYQYLIRVGYPDGASETLKGDVTLIR